MIDRSQYGSNHLSQQALVDTLEFGTPGLSALVLARKSPVFLSSRTERPDWKLSEIISLAKGGSAPCAACDRFGATPTKARRSACPC
jgi:hypothetical protein